MFPGKSNSKTLILFSGGIDSVCMMYQVFDAGIPFELLFIDYPHLSRNSELKAACYFASKLGVHLHVAKTPLTQQFFIDSRPFTPSIEGLKGKRVDIFQCLLHWLSIAASYAYYLSFDSISVALVQDDINNASFLADDFTQKISNICTMLDSGLSVVAPFLDISKGNVLVMAHTMGVEFPLAWSCIEGDLVHCGKCDKCIERKVAFSTSGVPDLTTYRYNL